MVNDHQGGSQRGRSTAYALVKVSNEFSVIEVMTIVFFDTENEYGSMW